MTKYDALIIGGGPAGSTAARLLAEVGWSVAVVEKAAFPRKKVCGEYLSPTNYALFDHLGILSEFLQSAGPEVRRIELVLKSTTITSMMPPPKRAHHGWGRALGRDALDTILLDSAVKAGVDVWQPWSVVGLQKSGSYFVSNIKSKHGSETALLESRTVIAAHGSWAIGPLSTQKRRGVGGNSDLFAFKALFDNAALHSDVMNMLVFPGGYAGMVNTDGGRLSFSFCIRRDYLRTLRLKTPSETPGKVVQDHILSSCSGIRNILSEARLLGDWLSTGPIRPGIRRRYQDGIFFIGNAAGEAHPTIADGISMAMQSAWLLAQNLCGQNAKDLTDSDLQRIGHAYDRAWLRAFRLRIWAAEAFARLALTPKSHALLLPMIRAFPRFLTIGAKIGGIVDEVIAAP